jgi:hypothetical protein
MNYSACYSRIIDRARSRLQESEYELHHIVPKCLGGSNTRSNLVRLTLKEHFVCHRLLVKMYQGEARQKMSFAYYRLCNRHRITSGRAYQSAKLEVKNALSKIHKGKTISDSHKQAIREKCRGMSGRKHSMDALTKMSQKKIGNNFAKVGVNVVDQQGSVLESFNSIAALCNKFDLTRGQAEHYIYKQRPFCDLLFQRTKTITR